MVKMGCRSLQKNGLYNPNNRKIQGIRDKTEGREPEKINIPEP